MSRSAFLGFTLLLNFSGLAGTIYVDPVNGNNAWTGLCETYDGAACGPKRTIAAAVAIAVNGDTVQLADGVYRGEGNADLALGGRAITLRGDTAAPSNIVIEFTSRAIRCVNEEPLETAIEGITFLPPAGGGTAISAVYLNNAGLTIRHCEFRDIRGSSGSAIQRFGPGELSVSDSRFINCRGGSDGGAVYSIDDGGLRFERCEFTGNSANYQGGAVWLDLCSAEFIDCVFVQNRVRSTTGGTRGAAIYANYSPLQIHGGRFQANDSGTAAAYCFGATFSADRTVFTGNGTGAIYANWAQCQLRQCAVIQNAGAGVTWINGPETSQIVNCTVAGNDTTAPGGGLNLSQNTIIHNTIVWANSAGGPSQVSIGGTYSAEIDYCTIQHGQSGVIGNHVWGANNLSDDPLLVPFTAGLISTVSPCIDRGTNTPIGGLNSHDWIGTLIPTDGDDDGFSVADIGAAEFDPHRPILTVPTTPLEFFDRVGGPNPAPQIIRLRNAGAVSMDWSVTSNCAEIVISPPRGQADREEDEIVVEVDTSQWPRGVYTCTLTVSAAGAINSPVSIPVTVSMGGTLRVPADIGTIQAAIDASLPGDEILLADGVFRGPGNRDLQIGDRRLTIRSASGIRENCVIDCEYASRGITFGGLETPETTIADLTITRGALTTRSATGAAVHVGGADPTIRNVQFKDNRLYGIFSRSATISGTGAPRLIDCQIETSASLGYGGAVELGVDAIVEHCTFERNKNHGTLLSVGAGSIVRGCRFIDNEMTTMLGHGGDGAPLQIERCYFERCVGEAVYATGTARLANCVIFDCEAPERLLRGVSGATVEVVNCTVIGNRVSGTTLDGFLGGSVTNSIFRNIAQRELQPGIVTTYSNVLGGVEGEGNINADALAAFARNAHLMPGSPCIDAGTNAPPGGLPTGDFDGYPRVSPANGIADIGAYEFPGDQALLATDQQELSISIMRDVPIATTTLNIRNAGVGAMDWVIASGCNWATAQPNSGGSDGEIDMVRIVCDAAALSAGEHSCEITIDAPGARLAPRTIGLTLRINSVRRVPQDYATIQAALDTATNGDIVELSDGQYSGPGNTELTFHGRLVHLRSASNDASRCVIDGDGTAALLVLDQREPDGASVENITLRNSGGGARAISLGMLANLRLRNCVVEDNTSGAINLADQSSLSLERCVVRNNSASQGGAIRMLNYASATWDDCVFQGNLADIGAVLHSNTGATVAHDCLIIDNRAQQGWFAWISGNYSALTLDGCTLANNRRTAPGQSALIFSEYRCGIRLWNTVSWFNDRPHAQGVWVDIVYVDYCDFEGGGSAFSFQTGEFDYGENNIESDPRFADVAAGDYRLTGSSPCVNAGDPGFEPAENDLDVFGNPRVAYRRIDMGAHEFRFPPGDMNCGGVVNNFDIDLFVLALTNPAAYEAAQPECDVRQADMNADGSVNNFDIDLFVDALDAG